MRVLRGPTCAWLWRGVLLIAGGVAGVGLVELVVGTAMVLVVVDGAAVPVSCDCARLAGTAGICLAPYRQDTSEHTSEPSVSVE
jgi:hypothetical protein